MWIRRLSVGVVIAFGLLGPAARAQAHVEHYEIQVDGLACPFCAYGLEKKLKKLPGVTKLKIDLNAGRARFDVTSGVLLPDRVQDAVEEAGFTPRGVTIRASGKVVGSGNKLQLDVGGGKKIHLDLGPGHKRLTELVAQGVRAVVISGNVRREGGKWRLTVSEAAKHGS